MTWNFCLKTALHISIRVCVKIATRYILYKVYAENIHVRMLERSTNITQYVLLHRIVYVKIRKYISDYSENIHDPCDTLYSLIQ